MITQKDIDRLLAGRKIIDGIKKPDSETLNTLHATAKISTKEVVTTAAKADAVVAREEVAKLLEIEKQSILDAEKALVELGFTGIGNFMDWDRNLSFEHFKECYPVSGKCDWCGLKDFKAQNCAVLFGTINSCGVNKPDSVTEQVARSSYMRYVKGEVETRDGVICSISYCPKNHGYYNDVGNFKTPQFDVFWGAK